MSGTFYYGERMSNFTRRHIGANELEQAKMLNELGFDNLDKFIQNVIPSTLISKTETTNLDGLDEHIALATLKQMANKNKLVKNMIGLGYYDTITPSVIKRNVFENPGWYTAYTPYQAEVSQGRLEALLNFQQMIMDLTGFAMANASLLDEATASSEAMSMARRINTKTKSNQFFIHNNIFPQTLSVIKTRAKYQDIEIIVGDISAINVTDYFGVLIQNPGLNGEIRDFTEMIGEIKLKNPNLVVVMTCDILSLVMFKSPAQMGADIAVGSTQRFGIPLGFGGPSAAYMATHDEYKRIMPGRIIGVSVDSRGKKALRMSLQTREQHIRREKATSNICTSQVLLANMAGFYAIYHGQEGLYNIAHNIMILTLMLNIKLKSHDIDLVNQGISFDTIALKVENHKHILEHCLEHGYAIGCYDDILYISFGESATKKDVARLVHCILDIKLNEDDICALYAEAVKYFNDFVSNFLRNDKNILTHDVFNKYHSETQIMRYMKYLENKDISLVHSMIALGSCTMKLNAASELEGLSWDTMSNIHPFAPIGYAGGYLELTNSIREQLKSITGFADISLQPNSGAQGEFAGLLAIRRYQNSINQSHRNICLIPRSAHGTNPATAQMMGLDVVVVACDNSGNVDVTDLEVKALQHKHNLSCLMITYPSTHGVFEPAIKQICDIVHANGGMVYMDGANLNALVGLVKPAELGADVSHINLHKTFAIPHGGGGPGMGPIGVVAHLAPFLPEHAIVDIDGVQSSDPVSVSSSPFGSSSILAISWMYITMLGNDGIKLATKIAILNANYMANKLSKYYPVLYTGQNNTVAHECIIDLRDIKANTGITEVDIAKRLMDYGFHAPTMSFPVAGTLMIEPTESEGLAEINRFIEAMILIHNEIDQVVAGKLDKLNNPLKNAPHTLSDLMTWDKPYSQELGCFPADGLKQNKVFPCVNRIDDAHGDRNFMCNCFDFT